MKIMFNTHEDTEEDVRKIVDFWYGRDHEQGQQKIIPVCEGCGKEVCQKVVNYCKHPNQKDRFKGKVYCKDCQESK